MTVVLFAEFRLAAIVAGTAIFSEIAMGDPDVPRFRNGWTADPIVAVTTDRRSDIIRSDHSFM